MAIAAANGRLDWKIAWSVPNVYADLCGGTAIYRSLTMWTEMFAPNGRLDKRVLRS
jgi:hypothetical protein